MSETAHDGNIEAALRRKSLLNRLSTPALWSAMMVAGALQASRFGLWERPTDKDPALWDYVAQVIVAGGLPYRDIVDIKTPLAGYVGALGLIPGRWLGIDDVIAIRYTNLLLIGLTAALVCAIARNLSGRLTTGLLATAFFLAFYYPNMKACEGTEPKVLMILSGVFSLWAVARNRPFLAGLGCGLSFLSWQPGLFFLGIAGLCLTHYLTVWRFNDLLRLGSGVLLPIVICFGYFYTQGALDDLIIWSFRYTSSVYGPMETHPPLTQIGRIFNTIEKTCQTDASLVYLGLGGAVLALLFPLIRWIPTRYERPSFGAIEQGPALATLAYFLFCCVSFQGPPDLLPLFPLLAIQGAFVIDALMTLWSLRVPKGGSLHTGAHALFLLLGVGMAAQAHLTLQPQQWQEKYNVGSLQKQVLLGQEILSYLGPGDRIYAHGLVWPLVITGQRNLSRHVYLDHAKDGFLNQVEPGGYEGWLRSIKEQRPRVIILRNFLTSTYPRRLNRLVDEEYQAIRRGKFVYYVRKS